MCGYFEFQPDIIVSSSPTMPNPHQTNDRILLWLFISLQKKTNSSNRLALLLLLLSARRVQMIFAKKKEHCGTSRANYIGTIFHKFSWLFKSLPTASIRRLSVQKFPFPPSPSRSLFHLFKYSWNSSEELEYQPNVGCVWKNHRA